MGKKRRRARRQKRQEARAYAAEKFQDAIDDGMDGQAAHDYALSAARAKYADVWSMLFAVLLDFLQRLLEEWLDDDDD